MRLWTYSIREAGRRPGRTLLTLLAIAVGTASVSAIALANQAARRAYRDLFEQVAGRAALEAVAAGQGGFDPACAADLAGIPGVKAVVPRVQAMAALAGPPAAEPLLVIGASDDAGAAGPHIVDGRSPKTDDEIALEAGPVRERGLTLCDHVHVWTPTGLSELRLTGVLEAGASAGGVHAAVLTLGGAQRLFCLPGQANSLRILLRHDADLRRVAAMAALRLPPGLTVQAPGARAELAGATLAAVRRGLDCLGAAVMVAAAFVVYNAFRLSAGERRRTLGTLRMLGATRGQVVRLLLIEALALGVVGAVIGIAAGPFLAALLFRAIGGLDAGSAVVHGYGALLAAAVIGPAAAVAAAFPAARSVRNSDLLEELRAPQGAGERPVRSLPWLGLALIAAGSGCLSAGGSAALRTSAVAAFLAGGALAAPPLLGPVIGLAGRLLSPVFGVECVLAARQLTRRPMRTGLTVGVLFLAVATTLAFGHWLVGSLRDLRQWYGRTIVADYLIRGAMPDTAFVTAAPLPDGLADEIARLDGVAAVDKIAFVPARVNGRPALALARTFAPDRPPPLDLRDGDADAVLRGLLRGEVVAGAGLGLARGGEMTLETGHGPERLRVVGVAAEYAGGGQSFYIEWEEAKRLLAVSGPHVCLVTTRRGCASPAASLKGFCDANHLLLQSNADLRRVIDRLLERVAGGLWALLALTFLVAGAGLANTLALNVHEQRRELVLLRVIGLRRGQVRRVVLWQALLIGLAALSAGTIAGLALAWLLGAARNPAAQQPSVYCFDWTLTVACWTAAIVCCTLTAGVLASRLPLAIEPGAE